MSILQKNLSIQELLKLDEELKYQVLFDDEGVEPGAKDRKIYGELKGCKISKEVPNLFRWFQFMKKFAWEADRKWILDS